MSMVMDWIIFLLLTLPLASKAYPSSVISNLRNDSDETETVLSFKKPIELHNTQENVVDGDIIVSTKKPVLLNSSQDNILREKNEIFHGKPYSESFMPSLERRSLYCRRKAKCERLSNNTCLGVKLPYSSSTTDLVALSQEEAMEKLQFWETLSHVPKCWALIQPFLCALYMPRCEDGTVDLPSQEMCKMAASACRILAEERHWVSPLKCDDITRFPPKCKNDVRELHFNTSAACMPPLVATDNPSAYFEGVEGCGKQCANPLFSAEDHSYIQRMAAWVAGLVIFISSFTILSFLIDWRYANRYPSVAVFYMNLCFLVTTGGFVAQFIPGARESIICRKDGTLRMSEPSDEYQCLTVFILVYYFLIATFAWFAIFMYAWSLQLQGLVAGKMKDRIDKHGTIFHIAAWSSPTVPMVATMATKSIDGNSELGICFVSMDPTARIFLFLVPVIILTGIGGYYSLRVKVSLEKLIKGCQEVISEGAGSKIRRNMLQVGLCSIFTVILVIGVVAVHVYEFHYRGSWQESFRNFVTCKIMRGDLAEGAEGGCRMTSKPSLTLIYVQLGIYGVAGFLTNSWVWTPSNFHTWGRFICRLLNKEEDEPVKLKKHQVIARTFAKRQALHRLGRISISIHSTRDDPVGLDFELNSMASRGMSSTWVAALPKLVTRRGALRISGSTSSQQRNSYDSDLSYGGRVSLESRRQSLDSQLSGAVGDMGRKPATPKTGVAGGRVKPRYKRRRGDFGRNLFTRRSSSTSQDSQLSVQLLSTLAMALPSIQTCVPNMKRRTGNAGLDGDLPLPLKSVAWTSNGVGPLFPLFHRNMSGSDEEAASPRDVPCRDSPGKDAGPVASASHEADKNVTGDSCHPAKEGRGSRNSAASALIANSRGDDQGALEREPLEDDEDVPENIAKRRAHTTKYSKSDVARSAGAGEDEPMVNGTQDSDSSDSDASAHTKSSTSRLKHAREIGTQTSMLSVHDIDVTR